jgi:hypothetical protein
MVQITDSQRRLAPGRLTDASVALDGSFLAPVVFGFGARCHVG